MDQTPLEFAAVSLHELFNSLQLGGFTESQALTIIARMVRG